MIEFLAHRGWWRTAAEKNSRAALQRAFAAGYGVETDVRDCDGDLVIAHDMPRRGTDQQAQLSLTEFLTLYISFETRPMLALNIKADGMAALLKAALSAQGVTRYFVFDMSVPDTLGYLSLNMPVYTRRSEFETGSSLDDRASGVWLDAFERAFVPASIIAERLEAGKSVVIVSPELHSKPHLEAWQSWRELFTTLSSDQLTRVMLCTDFPGEAAEFF